MRNHFFTAPILTAVNGQLSVEKNGRRSARFFHILSNNSFPTTFPFSRYTRGTRLLMLQVIS